jgi:GNAT superfamily N-acetyltransferase
MKHNDNCQTHRPTNRCAILLEHNRAVPAMQSSAKPVSVDEIAPWRGLYRQEMNCQIVHDSLHSRPGWTQSYLLTQAGSPAGYGATMIGGPWKGTRTLFEFFVLPNYRSHVFDLFHALREASQATGMEIQSNDRIITVMLHVFAHSIATDAIVFEDRLTTSLAADGAQLISRGDPDNDWALEADGTIAANGGILYHYNPPYGDIYMEVAEPFRRRGFGSYLVQELKRICYERGNTPAARCNPKNLASRMTLQKAGFVPYANLLTGKLDSEPSTS